MSSVQHRERLVECLAGHTWEAPRRGATGRWCPDHRHFGSEPLAKKNLPPDLEVERWKSTATRLGEAGYVKRWSKRWEEIVRIVAARQGTFGALPLHDINEYIRHERLAELHRHFAEQDPYPTTETGSEKAHPGWERARIEEVATRQSARKLGLIESLSTSNGKTAHPPTRLQEQAEDLGSLVDDQADL